MNIKQQVDNYYRSQGLKGFQSKITQSGNGTVNIRIHVSNKTQTGKYIGRSGQVVKELETYIELKNNVRVDIRVKNN